MRRDQPMIAGTSNAANPMMNEYSIAAATPGQINGRVTRRKVWR